MRRPSGNRRPFSLCANGTGWQLLGFCADMAAVVSRENISADRSLSILRTLFGARFARDFAIELWDGTRIDAAEAPLFTLKINEPFALRAAFAPPLDLSPGRAFVEKWIDIEGDIEAAIQMMEGAIGDLPAARAAEDVRAAAAAAETAGRHRRRRASCSGKRHYEEARRGGDRISLRSADCVLSRVSGFAHGLFVRVLGRRRADARRGPSREDRSYAAQSAPAPG